MLRNALQPSVVVVVVFRARGQQLDDATERTVGVEDFAAGTLAVVGASGVGIRPARSVVFREDVIDELEINLVVFDEDRSIQHVVAKTLADFALAAAADRAGFVAENAFADRADQTPAWSGGVFFELDFVTTRSDVNLIGREWNRLLFAGRICPANASLTKRRQGVFRDVDDARMDAVDAVSFRLNVNEIFVAFRDIGERLAVVKTTVDLEFVAQRIRSKCDRTAGVLFFRVAHQVGSVAELGFDFFLAITVIVVSDQSHDHAITVAAGEFERTSVVVAFGFVLPAHPVVTLAFGRVVVVRQPEFFLGQLSQVGCQDHATGVTTPVFCVETGVAGGDQRVARIAKDRFDEVQVADVVARNEEASFHRLRFAVPGNTGSNQWTQHQRHP